MKTIMKITILALAAFALAACGMNEQNPGGATGGSYLGSAAGDAVGTGECIMCHRDDVNPAALMNVVGDTAGSSGWINSVHSNGNNNPDTIGVNTCSVKCHDPLGDGGSITAIEAELGIDLGGFNRPVVGCEACHGSGADHFGIGNVVYPIPDETQCGVCHNADFYHNDTFPQADNILEDLQNSQHFKGGIHGDTSGDRNVKGPCFRCHTDEGARMYKDVQGDAFFLNATIGEGIVSNIVDASPVQCRTCHDPHDTGKLLQDAGTLHNVDASAEFNTCTNCHQTGDIDPVARIGNIAEPYHRETDPAFPRVKRTILDTHFDNALTTNIEGYVLDVTSDHVCSVCHNVHLANVAPDTKGSGPHHTVTKATLVNRQWAASAHGGHIVNDLANEDDNFKYYEGVANVTEAEAPAYVHYDFKSFAGGACRRCHTSAGFKYLTDNPQNGGGPFGPASVIGFYATGEQREMLYCWACHKDNAGGLRDDFIFSDVSYYSEPASRIAAVPDLGGSNLCMSCHSGRGTGAEYDATSFPISGKTFAQLTSSHYLTAGAVLFRLNGFENAVAGGTYDNPADFSHDMIGVGSGNGPCVGCHMAGDAGHTLEVAVVNGSDGYSIDELTNYADACASCHGATLSDETALMGIMNTSKEGFINAMEALEVVMTINGVTVLPGYPYFSNSTDWSYPQLKAAFNYNMLGHEPGAYAHNSMYTKRLIFDSIDELDNGTLDGSISVNEPANTYLNGGVRP